MFGRFDEELTKVIDPLFQTYNRGMISLPVNLPWTHYGSAIRARRKLANVIAEEVAKRDSGDHEPGLVAALLDEEGAQVPAQAMLGLLAGYETTAFTIAIVLHTMARYPDIIERLHKEHVTIMGSLQPITQQSDLKQLTLLDAAVRSICRFHTTFSALTLPSRFARACVCLARRPSLAGSAPNRLRRRMGSSFQQGTWCSSGWTHCRPGSRPSSSANSSCPTDT